MPVVILLALVLMLKVILPLDSVLRSLGLLAWARHGAHGWSLLMSPAFLLQWVYPFLVVGIFMVQSRLASRYRPSFAGPCLVTAVVLGWTAQVVYFAATLVPGGGMAFVVGSIIGVVFIPVRVLLVVGLVKMFLSLQASEGQRETPIRVPD